MRPSFSALAIVLLMVHLMPPPAAATGQPTIGSVTALSSTKNPYLVVEGSGFGGTPPPTSGNSNLVMNQVNPEYASWTAADKGAVCRLRVISWTDSRIVFRGEGLATSMCPVSPSMSITLSVVSTTSGVSSQYSGLAITSPTNGVELLDPHFGPETGGRLIIDHSLATVTPAPDGKIRIDGYGFENIKAVLFGDVEATSFELDSASSIRARPPPMGTASKVEVVVVTTQGSSHSGCLSVDLFCDTTYRYLREEHIDRTFSSSARTWAIQPPSGDPDVSFQTCSSSSGVSGSVSIQNAEARLTGVAYRSFPDQEPWWFASMASNFVLTTSHYSVSYDVSGSGSVSCDVAIPGASVGQLAGVYFHVEGTVSVSGTLTQEFAATETRYSGGFAGFTIVWPQPVTTCNGGAPESGACTAYDPALSGSVSIEAGLMARLGPRGLSVSASVLVGAQASLTPPAQLQGGICWTPLQVAIDAPVISTKFYPFQAYSLAGSPSQCKFYDLSSGTPAPGIPTNFVARPGYNRGQAQLQWSAPTTGGPVTAYRVYAGLSDGSLTQVTTLAPSQTSYALTGLAEETRYYFRVDAYNVGGVAQAPTRIITTYGNVVIHSFEEFAPNANLNNAYLGIGYYSNVYHSGGGYHYATGEKSASCSVNGQYNPTSGNCVLYGGTIWSSGRTFRSFEATFRYYGGNGAANANRIWFGVYDDQGRYTATYPCDLPTTGIARCGVASPTPIRGISISGDIGFSVDDVTLTQDITVQPPTTSAQDFRGVGHINRGETLLKWNATTYAPMTGTIIDYRIYRGTDPTNVQLIQTLPNTTFYFIDTGLADDSTYYYEIRSRNAQGEGPAATTAVISQGNEDVHTFEEFAPNANLNNAYLGIGYYSNVYHSGGGYHYATGEKSASCSVNGQYNPTSGNCVLYGGTIWSSGRTFRSFEATFRYYTTNTNNPNRVWFSVYDDQGRYTATYPCDLPTTGIARCGVASPTPIRGISISGDIGFSVDDVTLTQDITIQPPSTTVQDLRAMRLPTSGQVQLRWNATTYTPSTASTTGYLLYRGTSADTLSLVATLGKEAISYTDTGLANDVPYNYAVATQSAVGDGPAARTAFAIDTIGPTIAAHADVVAEGTDAAGAFVTYDSPTTSDTVDGAGSATCSPASGARFALGPTTVSCTAMDRSGNPASPTAFRIHVRDTTPPVIAAHEDVTFEATGPGGAPVSYARPATLDLVDGSGLATCMPASGTTFSLGSTTVACDATDARGNQAASTTFQIRVVDTSPPAIASHPGATAEATSAAGARVSYTPPASSDAVDGNSVATCTPASGQQFPLGTTVVSCTASDSYGNSANSTFTVVVRDTQAPTIQTPANLTVEATGPSGAIVAYTPPSTNDIVDGKGTANCLRAPGSTFPIGKTTVNCFATDSTGNHAVPAVFNVTVRDTSGPNFEPAGDIVAEATSSAGAVAEFATPAAFDAVDGQVESACTWTSGATFPLGETSVECTSADTRGNNASLVFLVMVRDTMPPSIEPAANVTAAGFDSSGTLVTFTAPAASDTVDGIVPVACDPESGTAFATGTTLVRCSAVDAAGNLGTTTFSVTVDAVVPQRPQNLTGSAGPGPSNITLTWLPPIRDGGLAIAAYRIYRDGTLIGSTSLREFKDQGLNATRTYQYDVTAVNGAGESLSISTIAASAPPPTAPRNLTALPSTSPGENDLSWEEPEDSFGIPILEYRIYARSGSDVTQIGETTGRSFSVSGCNAGQQCVYFVRAATAAGLGQESNNATAPGTNATQPHPAAESSPDGSVTIYNDRNQNGRKDPGEEVIRVNPGGL